MLHGVRSRAAMLARRERTGRHHTPCGRHSIDVDTVCDGVQVMRNRFVRRHRAGVFMNVGVIRREHATTLPGAFGEKFYAESGMHAHAHVRRVITTTRGKQITF